MSVYCSAQDLSTYEKRKQYIIDGLKNVNLVERGKYGLSKANARLLVNPHDAGALDYITNVLEFRGQSMFDFPGVALALCRYWDSFTPEQLNRIKTLLEPLAKEDKIVTVGFLGHGTENHATMEWSGGYLFGQQFPDAKWANGMSSADLMKQTKEWLRTVFKNIYRKGYYEYLSTTYEIVMNYPIEILFECAKDKQMRDIAEAFLLYKWALISLNQYEGTTLAPFERMNTQQDHHPDDSYISASTYGNWLLWGWGPATSNMKQTDFALCGDANYSIYTALANKPDDIFFRLASTKTPYILKSRTSSFGKYGSGTPYRMMRNIYKTKDYAIGTGNFRWVPTGDYADYDADGFIITWSSPNRFNYISCFSPFWSSDGDIPERTPDTWFKGTNSPFQQTAHNKSTVITLFDIPDKEPSIGMLDPEKWTWRDGHANNLLKRAMFRFPKTVDEFSEESGWIFLREGNTYIGVKPLKKYYIQNDLKGKGLDGFTIVKSDFAKTGFIFEVGSVDEFKSFKRFKEKLKKNKILVDWNKMDVSYTDSRKETLRIQYQPGLPICKEDELSKEIRQKGVSGLAESIPIVWVNGQKEKPYHEWPLLESPFANLKDNVLTIDDGQSRIVVDWRGDYPIITRK